MSLSETFHGRLDRDFMKLIDLQRHIGNIENNNINNLLKSGSNSSLRGCDRR